MANRLQQTIALQTKISPQQIQMIKLLELPTMQLEERIKREIEENIVLEEDTESKSEEGDTPEKISVDEYIGKEVIVGIRPECIHDDPSHLGMFPESCIDVDVDVTELMGAEIYLYLNSFDKVVEDGSNKSIPKEPTKLTARVSSRSTSRSGDKIQVAIDMSRVHIFDKDTERCIVH